MEQGWIKLHRKILNNPLLSKPLWAWLWIVLLLKVNHKETKMIWNNKIIVIKQGQFITGRKELSKQTGISESTVENILNYLESEHQIEQQKTTKYRLITIVNWENYQNSDNTFDNKKTTKRQQKDTNNNDKNENNEKKYTSLRSVSKKSAKSFSHTELAIYQAFKEFVNENILESVANRKVERDACKNLESKYGLPIVLQTIQFVLPKTNLLPHMPQIYTPSKLLEKWAQLSQAKDRKITETVQAQQKLKDKVGDVFL